MSTRSVPQRLWEAQLAGRPAIVKQRFSKQYRHPTLDRKLTAARLKQVATRMRVHFHDSRRALVSFTSEAMPVWADMELDGWKQEVRGMVRARKMGALTPVLYAVDLLDATISMEKVAGSTVKALLHSGALAGEGGCHIHLESQQRCLFTCASLPLRNHVQCIIGG